MYKLLFLVIVVCVLHTTSHKDFFSHYWSPYERKYGYFSEVDRLETLEGIKEMFYFGYDNYMKHAYPKDELDPIHCAGRGPDHDNPYVSLSEQTCTNCLGIGINLWSSICVPKKWY